MRSLQENVLLSLLRTSLGPEVVALMEDPRVTDLVINPDERVFVKRRGESWVSAGFTRPAAQTRTAVMTTGTLARVVVDESRPYLATQVPQFGWRMQAVLAPVVRNTTIVLRKPAPIVYSLASYLEQGRVGARAFEALRQAVLHGKNIVVAGATGSGKTTVLNALTDQVAQLCPTHRVLILEDTEEIQCSVPNVTQMLVREPQTMAHAVKQTMRMIPTRIVVGELRAGPETAALLTAWNTGHDGGLTSVHAGSARRALFQLEDYAATVPGAGLRRAQIAAVVQVVVFVADQRIEEVLRVHEELDATGGYQLEEVRE